jgi:drug/metabolite transporter (DMT)-like permease
MASPLPSRSSPLSRLSRISQHGLTWMILAQVFFAAMNVGTRLAARELPWSEIAATRFIVGVLIAIGLARYRGSSLGITDSPNTWRRSLFGTSAAVCTFYALASSRIALGDVVTLGATAPIFVALLSGPLLGERVGSRVWFAVALGFGGIMAVVQPSFGAADGSVALIATVGAVFYALAMIWLRRIGPGESHEAIVLHFSLVASATFIALSIPVWRWPGWNGAGILLATGLAGGGAQIAMTRAYSLARAAPVTALSGLSIVFTYLLAIPSFGDQPTLWQMAGSLLVIAASLFLTVRRAPVLT